MAVASSGGKTDLQPDLTDSVWPPPSTVQPPVFACSFRHGIIRTRFCSVWFYQPNVWSGHLEITEHGVGFYSKANGRRLTWTDVEIVTLAPARSQVCVRYHYRLFGFLWNASYIVPVDREDYVSLTTALRRLAKCRVMEDKEIYWSYRKTVIGFSIFTLFELLIVLNNTHFSHWVWYWKHMLKLLNHLFSLYLP